MKLIPGQHIHLVGIGGAGLSAIARILLGQSYTVSGSDRSLNALTDALKVDGATIYEGHDASYVEGADALIITSAVKPDHVEVVAAKAKGIPVYKRQEIIADLMGAKRVIAVAGTKGKTTTTAMIVHLLRACGFDPSYIVGGVMGNTGTNAGVGTGGTFVIEADEYENMFLGITPDVAVITNVEWDHPDFFKTPEEMVASFEKFAGSIRTQGPSSSGALVACVDDEQARHLIEQKIARNERLHAGTRGVVGYSATGAMPGVPTYFATNVRVSSDGNTLFDIEKTVEEKRSYVVSARLPLPGRHNIQNALAAFVVITQMNERRKFSSAPDEVCKPSQIMTALASFKPPARRFEVRYDTNQIAVVDDYAHNPMSIRAVLEAARQRYPNREVWAVWQPHTYSRTQALMGEFLNAFEKADHVLVTDIYAAREEALPGVDGAALAAGMQHGDVRHTATFEDAVNALTADVKVPAVIVIMSAGDAPQIGVEYVKRLTGHAETAQPLS